MAYPNFPTLNKGTSGPVAPGSGWASNPAVRTVTFGDRYSQRVPDGINTLPRDFSYQSSPLSLTQFKTLDDFLLGRKGYLPFMFLIPGESVARQFICEKWSASYDTPVTQKLIAVFKQNFDP